MSALAGTLTERVTLLVRSEARDDLGGAGAAWRDGMTVWAGVRPDGMAGGDDAGGLARFVVTVRTGFATVMAERLRWQGRVFAVRRVESDPAMPDRHILRVEQLR